MTSTPKHRRIAVTLIALLITLAGCISVYHASNGSVIDNDSGIKPNTKMEVEINKKDTIKNK